MSDTKHAKLAPSASSRWIHCPGSIRLSEQVPADEGSVYAREGTAAHLLGARCLSVEGRAPLRAQTFLGKTIVVDKQQFKIDQDMVDAVQEYVDLVGSTARVHMSVEHQFSLAHYDKDIYGTSDCCILEDSDEDGYTLHVIDYKHGAGVPVEVEWNTQLMIYGLGALRQYEQLIKAEPRFTKPIKHVKLVIVQPRAPHPDGHIRAWSINIEDLKYWALNVLVPAANATRQDNAPLHAGRHCRFCPAMAVCPEIVNTSCQLAKTEFGSPVLPEPADLTSEQVTQVLEFAELFTSWVGQVMNFVQSQMEIGRTFEGYKLVAKRANRKWVNNEEAAGLLEELLGEDAYEKKLLSVAKAEKALKAAGVEDYKDILADAWEKPETGYTVAPEDDKRPAVSTQASLDFLDEAEFLN